MNRISEALKSIKNLNERTATVFLILLLLGDLFYTFLHVINILVPPRNELLHIGTEGGFPEHYQYLKFFWLAALFIFIARKEKSFHYLSWAMAFAYFLLDDSLEFHENSGRYFARTFEFTPPLGLSLQELGELGMIAAAGFFLSIFLIWAYWKGSEKFKKISIDIVFLIMILVFCGVAVDFLNEAVDLHKLSRVLGFIGTFLEDGGEMLSVSFLLWYAFLIKIRDTNRENYIFDILKNFFKKRSD